MDYKKTLTTSVLGIVVVICILEYVYIPLFGMKPGVGALPFWQHPPRAILFHALYLIHPGLVKPADFLFGWCVGLGVWLGFRQVFEKNALDNLDRQRLFSFIRDHPGIHYRELERETGINRGTLSYHLEVLGHTHKILPVRDSGHMRYFENNGKYSELEQKILSSLNNKRKSTILHSLLDSPSTQAELRRTLEISGPSVAWHMKRLCIEGIVSVERQGREQKYRLGQESEAFLKNYFSASPRG